MLLPVVFAAITMGGSLPLPVYALWAARFGYDSLTTTLVFAAYALGVLAALLLGGSLSDVWGRKPVLGAAIAAAIAGTACLIAAPGLPVLLIGRALSGIAIGLTSAAATAAITETITDPRRSGRIAATANLGGLALGGLLVGVVAQYLPARTTTAFWFYLALLVAVAAAWLTLDETSGRRRTRFTIRAPRLPRDLEARRDFLVTGAAVAAAFGLNGFFSSLAPGFLRQQLGVDDLALGALGASLATVTALGAQVVLPESFTTRTRGCGILIAGVGLVELANLTDSAVFFFCGSLVSGFGIGTLFRVGLQTTARLAAASERAGLNATLFICIYTGLVIPTLLTGALDEIAGSRVANTMLAALIIATSTTALILGRTRGTATRSGAA